MEERLIRNQETADSISATGLCYTINMKDLKEYLEMIRQESNTKRVNLYLSDTRRVVWDGKEMWIEEDEVGIK